ncbi:MAG: 1-acyl-sn-glycerol-3-phosphate acyltransferase [Rhodothermales bacterium]
MLKKSSLHINLDLREEDLDQLFEPFDPLRQASTGDTLPPLPPSDTPFDPIDWDYLEAALSHFISDIAHHYFRGRIIGADKLPEEGPLIVAPNHSGNAFPHDAMVLDALLWQAQGFRRDTKFRSVFSPKLAATWWMRPFALDNWWRRAGGVDMTFANYNALLRRGDKVIYYPEGVPGIGKGFLKRYQLQHFYSSFVVLAARHNAPIFPVSVVNAEWVNPTSVTFDPINKLFDKLLGLPFFPVPIVFLAFLFPFLFYLAFPCKMVFVIGDPIDVRALFEEEGNRHHQEPDRETVLRVAERIRQASQRLLDAAVAKYGHRPYDLEDLRHHLRQVRGRVFRTIPLGWPYAFIQHDRNRQRPPARHRLHAFLRDLDILVYFLPLGWFLLALLRRLRKPPCGYRGLTKTERIEREGAYRWSLATRPLPEKENTAPP